MRLRIVEEELDRGTREGERVLIYVLVHAPCLHVAIEQYPGILVRYPWVELAVWPDGSIDPHPRLYFPTGLHHQYHRLVGAHGQCIWGQEGELAIDPVDLAGPAPVAEAPLWPTQLDHPW